MLTVYDLVADLLMFSKYIQKIIYMTSKIAKDSMLGLEYFSE